MSYTINLEELRNPEKVYRTCSASSDPIFISANGQAEMVLINLSSYKKMFAKLQVYQKLEEGEADISAGRESNAFEMLNHIGVRSNV